MTRKVKTTRPASSRALPRFKVERLETREVPAVFNITNGDVPGLIAAINTSNTNGESDTINLAPGGTYTLTTVDNNNNGPGPNGLPVFRNDGSFTVAVNGRGAILERAANAPAFRLINMDRANLTVNDLTLSRGLLTGALQVGAGIRVGNASTFTLNESLVIGCANQGDQGGGMGVVGANSTVTVTNSTFAFNSATGTFSQGAGIYIGFPDGAVVNLINDTIAQNTTNTNGGGVYVTSFSNSTPVLNVQNCIIALNTQFGTNFGFPNGDLYRNNGLINASNNIISALGIGVFTNGPTINGTNVANLIGVDPILGPLQDNGGLSSTYALLIGSPAIDAGNSRFAVGAFDQRGPGFARVFGGIVDEGAFEAQAVPPPPGPPPGPPPIPAPYITPGIASQPGVPPTPTAPGHPIPETPRKLLVGSGAGDVATVRVLDPKTGAVLQTLQPYAPGFTGGVNVASGDVTGDGVADIVSVPASHGGADVRVFDGVTGAQVTAFLAYDGNFDGGATIAVADVDGDGVGDIITGAGAGGGPNVRVFQGKSFLMIQNFLAYDQNFTGGVFVTGADFYADGKADIITAPGIGGGADIRLFMNGDPNAGMYNFMGADARLLGGAVVAAGDFNGDGLPDLAIGLPTGNSTVQIYKNLTQGFLPPVNVYPGTSTGLRIAAVDTTGSGVSTLFTSPTSGSSNIRGFALPGTDPGLNVTLDGTENGAVVG